MAKKNLFFIFLFAFAKGRCAPLHMPKCVLSLSSNWGALSCIFSCPSLGMFPFRGSGLVTNYGKGWLP